MGIHKLDFPICIGHMDLPGELWYRRQMGETGILKKYAFRFQEAGVQAVVAAVFVHPSQEIGGALASAMGQIGALNEEIGQCDGQFVLVTTGTQLDQALKQEKIALVLSLEGTQAFGTDLLLLRTFYALGVRILALTWNGRTMAADGCTHQGSGLTDFGRAVVKRAGELGMILDVSHLNDTGFWEVLRLFPGKIIASHSNCRALCNHPRNLTDQQILALGERGTVVGLNQIRFLTESPQAGHGHGAFIAHGIHLLNLLGPQGVGLGVDLAVDYMQALPKPQAFWEKYNPLEEDIWRDYTDAAYMAAGLLEKGKDEKTVASLLGGNFIGLLRGLK